MERVARETYRLPASEKLRVEKLLNRTLQFESGDLMEEDLLENEKVQDGANLEDIGTPPTKKLKTSGSKESSPKKRAGPRTKASSLAKDKEKEKKLKVREKGKKPKGERGKGPDGNLKPNPKIKILEKDPFFDGKDPGPFISVTVQSRLAFSAVANGDVDLLKELIISDKVYRLDLQRSPDVSKNPLDFAIGKESKEMIELLVSDIFSFDNKRVQKGPPVTLLKETSTGMYNPVFLGVEHIRSLSMSRGGKEGNSAFAKDIAEPRSEIDSYIQNALVKGISPDLLDFLINLFSSATSESRDSVVDQFINNIYIALQNGHRQIAARLVAEAVRLGGYGYNYLHEEVLRFTKEDLRDHILAASVRKKPFDNRGITPLHCAAINPNVKYLKALLTIEPDITLMDRSHKRLIHYAAVCEGTGPLEFLLQKGANPYEADSMGNLPLHRACDAGRAHNVSVLLKYAQNAVDKSDPSVIKWGVGGVDRPNRSSLCPIHLAVMNGHMDVLRVLLKNNVNVNKPLSASKKKVTPLMLAAQQGFLDMARLLVQSGSKVELTDKLKRTALTHAVINGNANVASYLLYLGADPNHVDSSGNSLVHYAAAYGWYHCLRLLIKDGGAAPNVENEWKTTPLAIAFLKGHTGIVDFLLSLPKTDINFRNDEGMTLVSIAASSRLQPGLEKEVDYLVKEKGADPKITDINGFNALHHLCANNIKLKGNQWSPEICEEAMDTSVKIARTLIEAGCDVSLPAVNGKTPVSLALEMVNYKLVQLLVDKGSQVPSDKNEEEKNILHIMAEQCVTTPMSHLLHILAGKAGPVSGDQADDSIKEEKMEVEGLSSGGGDADSCTKAGKCRPNLQESLKKMAAETDFLGFTPLLRACQVYRMYQVPRNLKPAQVEQQQENGRQFIRALIEVAGSDVNATVQAKNIPDAKIPQYTSEDKDRSAAKVGAKEINSPGLQLLLEFSPNLELCDMNSDTPLTIAVCNRDIDKVQLLLEKGANPNVSFSYTERKVTPVIYAAIIKDLALVRLLLNKGADASRVDESNKFSLLHYLVLNRGSESEIIELLKTLIQKGVGVNARSKDGTTPLHVAVASNAGGANTSTTIEEFLLSHKADVFAKTENGNMPLHKVFDNTSGDPIELCSLLTSAMNDKMVDEPNSLGMTPLHLAAAQGATICCTHLIKRQAQINRKDLCGNTPLSFAIKNKKDSCAIVLLQQEANVNHEIVLYDPVVERQKESPVKVQEKTQSVEKKEKTVLKWRPLQQQQKKETERKREAYSIFQGALYNDLQGVAYLLLDKTGIGFSSVEAALNVNKYNVALRLIHRAPNSSCLQGKNKENQTLFHILAWKTRAGAYEDLQLKVAQALLEKGVPVNTVDNQGCTPVHYCAIQHQPVSLARFLIENSKNFDVKLKDKMGRDLVSAVMWDYEWVSSASSKAMAWLDLLLEKGLTLNVTLDRPLADILLFGACLASPCPDYFTTKGSERVSPLMLAIRNYNFGLARYLLQKGADPNFKDSMGLTPLMHAVKMNDLTLVKLLLNYDYNKDILEKPAKILGTSAKPVLEKRLSRHVFTIRPDKMAEEMQKDPSVDEDEGEIEEEEDDAVDVCIESEEAEEVAEEDENIGEVNGIDDDDLVDDEGEGDSDRDTDIVDDDEEVDFLPTPAEKILPRLGSKQLSLTRSGSCVTEKYHTVEKTSPVDLDLTDTQGLTTIHHAVCSLDYGTYDNPEMVFVLAKAGANITKRDHAGLPPLEWALLRGAPKIAKIIQEIVGRPVEEQDKPTYSPFDVSDGILGDGRKVNYLEDADSMSASLEEAAMEAEFVNTRPTPDKNCDLAKTGEVYHDQVKDLIYDVTLSKVEVSSGPFGMYNFYKMQIIWQKGKDLYVLFTRWGRIGDRGQWQHTAFGKPEDAVKEFCKIFRQKTGNDWNNISKFVNHPKKYRLLPKEEPRRKLKEVDFTFTADTPSKLSAAVQDLLQELTNVSMLHASAKAKGLDEDIMPFGHIQRDVLIAAHKILQQLEELIVTVNKQQKNLSTVSLEEYQQNCEKIASLTNEFYHLVPVGGFEYDVIRPIRDLSVLKEHMRLVADLMDMEVASKILLGSQYRLKEMNPLDYIYRSIGCKIQPLNESETETQYILTYINASGHGCRVNAIYKVSRPGEADTMATRRLDNHYLLWHGTSMANVISILARGLLVAPADVPITGHLFGEGIYFADCFKKSRSYCYNPTACVKVAFLCEVALGNVMEDISHDEEDHLDQDVNSLKILGKSAPDSDFDVALPYGATIPLGQLKHMNYAKPPQMPYNEYVIHDPSQICLRYLVMFDG
ncbi:LOW QUALITY PROTEIN: tankyrase-like protein [Pomacea canaliculata]|uniref:LOW QUALITY PROTEIN: tankyrase-like protein n=1 Tax=Pomacea canaliculata TaxID=400727 RepID=UPI000D72A1FE|nr:LOW QUALITY PROTEIN: tankyrase-like protein [Pomacea canaliculata]